MICMVIKRVFTLSDKSKCELAADIQRSDLSEYGLFLTENGDGYEYREEEEQDITIG